MKYVLVALSLIFVTPAFACGDAKMPNPGNSLEVHADRSASVSPIGPKGKTIVVSPTGPKG